MGKFELFQDRSKKWRWNLKAGNGEVIATSESYSSKQAAKNGIKSVKWNAVFANVIEVEK